MILITLNINYFEVKKTGIYGYYIFMYILELEIVVSLNLEHMI